MKSQIISFFSLFAITFFVVVLFIYMSQNKMQIQRVGMQGDEDTNMVLAKIEKARRDAREEERRNQNGRPAGGESDLNIQEGDLFGSNNTVVWINIPGFRGDYIEKSSSEFMQKLVDEGSSTEQMRPNFPSLTFPGHMNLATGTTVAYHGIPSDRFRVNGAIVNNPKDSSILQAEPIWETATRQGKATLVHDWPLSQQQTGPNKALYFLESYDQDASDQQRLDRLWDAWIAHKGEKKLQLLMCRLNDILKAGQENGPLSDDTHAAVKKTDEAIKGFFTKVQAAWPNLRAGDGGNLCVVITTDHGLSELDQNVNLSKLLGEDLMQNLDVAAHDAVAHLYFKNLSESEAEADLEKQNIEDELRKKTYFKTYSQDTLPSAWKYTSSDGRIGDRVLVLKDGFAFSDYEADSPVFNPSEGPALYGGFGYSFEEAFRMSGQAIIWSYPEQIGGGSMGSIDQTVFHSSVCKVLNIQPSEKANKSTVNF